jgi:hypothetical protein
LGPDRTCIEFSLPVDARGTTAATPSAPHVSYRDLTAPERGAYLRWLAAGRTRPPDHPAFMTMFAEGIERRLLLDKCDGNVLAKELVRLLPLCPADDGARTLIYKLLAYATAAHHITELSRPSLEVLVDQLDVKNNMTVDVAVLGWLSAWKKPLPAAWVWRLLWRLRVPQKLGTTREFAQHRAAFVAAFSRSFPEGFVLPLPPATRLISYYPSGHAVLEHFGWSSCPPVLVPDALSSDQLMPLLALWRTTVGAARDRKAAGPAGATAQSTAATPVRVALDPQAVQRVLADTEAAQRLLADVFADEQEECQAPPPSVAPAAPGTAERSQTVDLPKRYRPVLQALLDQAEWERPAFVALVRRHRLMPDDTLAAINTWAEDALGDLLIEDTGSLHVNTRLVETRE